MLQLSYVATILTDIKPTGPTDKQTPCTLWRGSNQFSLDVLFCQRKNNLKLTYPSDSKHPGKPWVCVPVYLQTGVHPKSVLSGNGRPLNALHCLLLMPTRTPTFTLKEVCRVAVSLDAIGGCGALSGYELTRGGGWDS